MCKPPSSLTAALTAALTANKAAAVARLRISVAPKLCASMFNATHCDALATRYGVRAVNN